jgi:hypothetical protein
LVIFWRIKGKQGHLNEMQNLRLYGIFYVGLNEDSFYWEILVMNGRKIILIIVSTFFSSS